MTILNLTSSLILDYLKHLSMMLSMSSFMLCWCIVFTIFITPSTADNEDVVLYRLRKLEQAQLNSEKIIAKQQEEIEQHKTLINEIQRELTECRVLLKQTTNVTEGNRIMVKKETEEFDTNSTTEITAVGFTATLTQVHYMKAGMIIPFDFVTFNEGNGYNGGIFTCPKTGIYLFLWNIMSDIGDDAHVALYVNGTPRRWSYAVSTNQMSNAANFYLTRLNISDRVYLAVYAGEDTISPIQSTFTGLLIP